MRCKIILKLKKNIILFIFILLFFLTACTENGVECGLTGKWNIVDFEFDNSSVEVDELKGFFEIKYTDTYEIYLEFETNSMKFEMDDYGEVKACSYNKYMQFFSDDNDENTLSGNNDSLNCQYQLNGSNLKIISEDFTMELIKIYQ